ncbi:hypothetical protein C8J57DRAFT_1222973 [Mycena rebaudengoi]|nr:hypothetical protein C8J57DRAFT_1222973 [Mycena rebaudengoi]
MAGKMDPSGICHALLNLVYCCNFFIQPLKMGLSPSMLLDAFYFFLGSWEIVGETLGSRRPLPGPTKRAKGPGLNDGPKGLRPGGGIPGCGVVPGVEKKCLGAPGETEKFGWELPDMSHHTLILALAWHEANVPMKTKVLNVQLHWDSIGKAGAPTQSPTRSGAPGSFKSWVGAPTPFPIFPGHPQDLRELPAHFKNCAGAPAQSPGMVGAPGPLQEWRELPAHFTYQLGAPVICKMGPVHPKPTSILFYHDNQPNNYNHPKKEIRYFNT